MNTKKTTTPILYPRKDKDNLYPVKLRITEKRKSQFIPLGFSVAKSHWLKSTRRISSSHPNHIEYNYLIEQKLKEHDTITKKYGVVKVGKMNVFADLDDKIRSMSGKQYYTAKRYRTLYIHLNNFWGNLELGYHEIDKDFFVDFRKYLQDNIVSRDEIINTPSNNTIVNYLNTLKTFLLEKQREGIYISDLHFTKGIIPTKKSTPKRTLDIDEIWKLDNLLPSHPGFRRVHWNALNTFMFNFWSQGLRIGDCLRLKWGNIKDDVIEVRMEKTDRDLIIPLNNSNIHRIKWYISEKDLFPIWNWERREWNHYYTLEGEEKNDIERNTLAYPLDLLADAEYKYQIDWLNMIEEEKDNHFDSYKFSELQNHWRKKDRYGLEYHTYFKKNNPVMFETIDEKLDGFNKELRFTINMLSKDDKYRNQFIFPYLRGYEKEKDLTKLGNKISSSVAQINKSLREIGNLVGIDKKFSNHWSRHSITSISKAMGVDLYELKTWLGHTSVKTTENYVNSISTHSSVRNSKKIKSLLENPDWKDAL